MRRVGRRSCASPRSSRPPTTGACSGRSATIARCTTCSRSRMRSRARSSTRCASTSFADLATPSPRRYTENVEAYGLYLRGPLRVEQAHAGRRRPRRSSTSSRRSRKIRRTRSRTRGSPTRTRCTSTTAACRCTRDSSTAKHYARKAIALDDTLAEAHASLAWSLFIYDWDWDERRARVPARDRARPAVRDGAPVVRLPARVARGARRGAGRGHTAQELDPASVSVRRSLGWLLLLRPALRRRRATTSTRAIAMNPAAEETYRVLGLTLAISGHAPEAERVLRRRGDDAGTTSYTYGTLGYALGRAGSIEEARAIADELEHQREREYVSPSRSRRSTWGSATTRARWTGPSALMRSGAAGWTTST